MAVWNNFKVASTVRGCQKHRLSQCLLFVSLSGCRRRRITSSRGNTTFGMACGIFTSLPLKKRESPACSEDQAVPLNVSSESALHERGDHGACVDVVLQRNDHSFIH